jgi:CelD/BcsL family acetyltransferase involved in cellulose biosynthesis
MTDSWLTDSFDLSPIAPDVGPFPCRNWLKTWWEHRSDSTTELLIGDTGDSLVVLVKKGDRVGFAGEPDLTDYHTPLGSASVPALAELIEGLPTGSKLVLDSLPEQAADAVGLAVRGAGLTPVVEQHALAAVLTLPDTFDGYLAAIGKKERHELRRKRRKFDRDAGPSRVERRSGADAVALFADLHRRSFGDKGEFMTDDIEEFFLALHNDAGGVMDVLIDGSGRPASAIFSFEDENGFYLYNSAFDPEMIHLSPGNVMLSHLIERSIGQGKRVFDFLKGDEKYKFRLGAMERPLFCVTAEIGPRR